jgi:hypothetical protein
MTDPEDTKHNTGSDIAAVWHLFFLNLKPWKITIISLGQQ